MGRGVEKLHPELIPICNAFVAQCRAQGLPVRITETLRTKEEQDALYAQGRTQPGAVVTNAPYPKSAHCWGVAFDFCRNVKGSEYDDSDGFFARCGAVGEKLGLTWGGSWKSFQDKPHLELSRFMPNSSTNWLISTYGTPERFFNTWTSAEDTPPAEEEETMTQDMFDTMLENYLTRLAAQAPADWSESGRAWAEANGIIRGDENGSKQYKSFVTREQLAVMLERMSRLN